MSGVDVVAEVTVLAQADPATCDRGALADLVARSQRVRAWLDACDARIALAASRLAEQGACEAPTSLLAGGGRRAAREAEAVARRGLVCDELPSLHDALADGDVSAGHVDAVARALPHLDERGRTDLRELESDLVESAKTKSVEQFDRELQRLSRILSRDDGVSRHEQLRRQRCVKRWVDRQTGMCITQLHLDPETDARVSAALDGAVAAERAKAQDDERTFDQLKADALVGLITGPHGEGRSMAPEVTVLIDLDTLRNGLSDDSVCETGDGQPLPPDTIRRLCCEAEIIPAVLNTRGELVDIGRSQRVANRAQRRALRAMYRSCAHPDCTVRFADCDIHHVVEWHHGGVTDLANLLPLCSRHHHMVHEGRWTLVLHGDRTITLRRPDGTIHFQGSTVDVRPATTDVDDDELSPLTISELADLARQRVAALGPPGRTAAA